MFQCAHKYHLPCLDKAGCAIVSNLGDETWHCYECISAKSQGTKDFIKAGAEGGGPGTVPPAKKSSEVKKVNLDEDALKRITDQRLVKAKVYLENMNSSQSALSALEQMNSGGLRDENDFLGEHLSFYDKPDFPLKLWAGSTSASAAAETS